MPKRSQYPRLRVHIKRGKAGQVWTSYWFDNRGTGQPDEPLGTDRDVALRRWAELYHGATRTRGTLEEAFAGWEARGIEHREDGTARKPATIAGYRKCLAMLRPVLGRATWSEVTLPVLRRYVQQRSSKARARQEMQLMAVVWTWARLEGLTDLPWPGAGTGASGWKGAPSVRQREVTDEEFAALHRHADQVVRDALDVATATGLRPADVVGLRLSDIRGGLLVVEAGKTGKRLEIEIAGSVLADVIERRRAMRRPEHLFLLADEGRRRPISQRALAERFDKARAAAAAEVPSVADVLFRDMRKRAAQLAPDLHAAQALLDHSSAATTRQHYRPGSRVRPVR